MGHPNNSLRSRCAGGVADVVELFRVTDGHPQLSVNSPEVEERLGRKRLRERYERTQPSEPSAPLVEPGSAEEPDQAILDDLPKLPNPIPVLIDEHHTVLVYTLIDADPEWTAWARLRDADEPIWAQGYV